MILHFLATLQLEGGISEAAQAKPLVPRVQNSGMLWLFSLFYQQFSSKIARRFQEQNQYHLPFTRSAEQANTSSVLLLRWNFVFFQALTRKQYIYYVKEGKTNFREKYIAKACKKGEQRKIANNKSSIKCCSFSVNPISSYPNAIHFNYPFRFR